MEKTSEMGLLKPVSDVFVFIVAMEQTDPAKALERKPFLYGNNKEAVPLCIGATAGVSLCIDGEFYGKGRMIVCTLRRNLSVCIFHNGFGDGKAKTITAGFAGTCAVRPVKPVEYVGERIGGNLFPGIPHGQDSVILFT